MKKIILIMAAMLFIAMLTQNAYSVEVQQLPSETTTSTAQNIAQIVAQINDLSAKMGNFATKDYVDADFQKFDYSIQKGLGALFGSFVFMLVVGFIINDILIIVIFLILKSKGLF